MDSRSVTGCMIEESSQPNLSKTRLDFIHYFMTSHLSFPFQTKRIDWDFHNYAPSHPTRDPENECWRKVKLAWKHKQIYTISKAKKAIRKLASFERYLLPIRTGPSNIVLVFQFSPYMLTPFWQDVMNSSTYSEMGMICYFDHIWGLTNHCQTRVGDFVKWGLGALKRQNVSPRPGNEPGSPAIHMERRVYWPLY